MVAGATTFPPAGGLYSSLCVSFILPPLAGEVRRSRKGGGERSEPISRKFIMPYDTESKSRNVLASPLGEEGHEVAKGVQANWIHRGAPRPANPVRRHPAKSVWTVVILIMILDVDVTAAGVSKGEAALFLHDCMLLANTVISSGDACRYGADGKRFNDTLSREISRRNDAHTIRGRRFLHSASLQSK